MSEDNINNDVNLNFSQHYFKLRPFEFVGFITANLKTAHFNKNKKSKINEENKSFRLLYRRFTAPILKVFEKSQFKILKWL